MEKTYEIWSEGYAATGQSSGAIRIGRSTGKTFQEACDKYFLGDDLYDKDRLTYWGCKLFDNETQARASFG